jgi:hypothetical protein
MNPWSDGWRPAPARNARDQNRAPTPASSPRKPEETTWRLHATSTVWQQRPGKQAQCLGEKPDRVTPQAGCSARQGTTTGPTRRKRRNLGCTRRKTPLHGGRSSGMLMRLRLISPGSPPRPPRPTPFGGSGRAKGGGEPGDDHGFGSRPRARCHSRPLRPGCACTTWVPGRCMRMKPIRR